MLKRAVVQQAESSDERRWYPEMDVACSRSPRPVDNKKQADSSRRLAQAPVEPPKHNADAPARDPAPVHSRLGPDRDV